LPPEHIERVYFEFMIRYDAEKGGMPLNILIEALTAEGCIVATPRYPLLHQQPFFTHEIWKSVARLPDSIDLPIYKPDALPRTETANHELIKLPVFPNANQDLLDQYTLAFEKVLSYAEEITARSEFKLQFAND
ncbi:MAG: hypothetical protein AAB336_03840, partial [Acidobacteriota bacterium]